MDVLRSAYRHGIAAEDIHRSVRNAVVAEEIDEDPVRLLVLGPTRAATYSN